MHQYIEGYRISRQQSRRWLLSHTQPSTTRCVIRLAGPLQDKRLHAAIIKIISQHSILRTELRQMVSRKRPMQVISQEASFIWTTQEISADEMQQCTEIFLNKKVPDEYEAASLACHLLKISTQEHLLLLSIPEFCGDLSTAYKFMQQVVQEYSGGQPEDEEPVQYIQFSEWQHELFDEENEDAAAGKHFWEQYQWGRPEDVRLPYDKYCPTSPQTTQIYKETPPYLVERSLVKQLQTLAERYEVTFSSALLSAWQTLLWRLIGQDDLLIGYFCAGQDSDELQNALGLFSIILPLHSPLTQHMHFHELLQQTEATLQNTLEWQDYFSWPGDQDASYFLPLSFAYLKLTSIYHADNLTFRIEKHIACEERFALKLLCIESEGDLKISLCYDSSLFTAEQMDYSLAQYQEILSSILHQPDALLYKLEVRGSRERQSLVSGQKRASQTECPYVHKLFEDQAERMPDRLALVCDGQTFTYRELNARANQLAHYLQKQGVGPDTLVGLSGERSCNTIIGLLGIMKAGGAFVPLDMAQPEQRFVALLADIQAPIILMQSDQSLPTGWEDTQIIHLHSDWARIEQESTANPHNAVNDHNLVYIIFTSGSTGTPKGVAVEHRQLANYVSEIQQNIAFPAQASYALVSSIVADLGHTMLFLALCSSGCLHFLNEEQLSSAEELINYTQTYPIDCLKIVPSHLQALLTSTEQPGKLLPRKQLILGGEAATWGLVRKVHELAPNCMIFNHYGPTETTVGVMTYKIDATLSGSQTQTLPLNHPLACSDIYLLDQHLQPVPVGGIGELYIGGATVSRGYLKQPALTAERFIAHPFSEQPGERLYRTGDLACLLADGSLRIVGRSDDQVKFHGHRLELNELRYILNQHAEIKDSVIVLKQDRHGRDMLVAYYVARVPLKYSTLHGWLAHWIPDEINPNIFIHLPRLPLRSNGKIDYQALPSSEEAMQERERNIIAPRTPLEETLVAIWSRVLHVEQISIEDNFFELWGDSILGIQLIAAAGEAGISITLKQLFEHPTIAELVTIDIVKTTDVVEEGPVVGEVELTPIQHWFFAQDFAHPNQWGVAVMLKAEDIIDADLIERALEHLYHQHDVLRSRFKRSNTSWRSEIVDLQQPHPPLLSRRHLTIKDQQSAGVQAALLPDLFASLNLDEGPLVQAVYITQDVPKTAQLLLVIHRLLIDGYSWRLLLEQFQQIYQQLVQGDDVHLPAKTTSYKHWAEHLMTYARSEQLHQQLDYWINNPKWQQVSSLPIDGFLPDDSWGLSEVVTTALSVEETSRLLQDVLVVYNTEITALLLTALADICRQWTKATTWTIDLESHGREELFQNVNLSRTVGWFTALFPLPLTVGHSEDCVDILKEVKEQIAHIPDHGIGYGVLRYLSPDITIRQALEKLPAADIHFRYTGQFHRLPGQYLVPFDQQEPAMPTRQYRLEVICSVFEGCFNVSIFYNNKMYHRATIEQLVQSFLGTLRNLIERSQNTNDANTGYTPSDFPLAGLDQEELDALLAMLSQKGL